MKLWQGALLLAMCATAVFIFGCECGGGYDAGVGAGWVDGYREGFYDGYDAGYDDAINDTLEIIDRSIEANNT